MEQALKEAREFFESLNKEEFKSLLEEAGFDVQDGSGKVNMLEDSFSFTVEGKFKVLSKTSGIGTYNSFSFPKAS